MVLGISGEFKYDIIYVDFFFKEVVVEIFIVIRGQLLGLVRSFLGGGSRHFHFVISVLREFGLEVTFRVILLIIQSLGDNLFKIVSSLLHIWIGFLRLLFLLLFVFLLFFLLRFLRLSFSLHLCCLLNVISCLSGIGLELLEVYELQLGCLHGLHNLIHLVEVVDDLLLWVSGSLPSSLLLQVVLQTLVSLLHSLLMLPHLLHFPPYLLTRPPLHPQPILH
jgi:hypothetical protein